MAKSIPAPLSAELLAVPKGAAAPASKPTQDEAPELPRRPAPDVAPPPIEEVRTALTVRLPVSTQERLREAAHRTRREKQAIVDEALLAWLDEHGY
jgi:hypothetical protein